MSFNVSKNIRNLRNFARFFDKNIFLIKCWEFLFTKKIYHWDSAMITSFIHIYTIQCSFSRRYYLSSGILRTISHRVKLPSVCFNFGVILLFSSIILFSNYLPLSAPWQNLIRNYNARWAVEFKMECFCWNPPFNAQILILRKIQWELFPMEFDFHKFDLLLYSSLASKATRTTLNNLIKYLICNILGS